MNITPQIIMTFASYIWAASKQYMDCVLPSEQFRHAWTHPRGLDHKHCFNFRFDLCDLSPNRNPQYGILNKRNQNKRASRRDKKTKRKKQKTVFILQNSNSIFCWGNCTERSWKMDWTGRRCEVVGTFEEVWGVGGGWRACVCCQVSGRGFPTQWRTPWTPWTPSNSSGWAFITHAEHGNSLKERVRGDSTLKSDGTAVWNRLR